MYLITAKCHSSTRFDLGMKAASIIIPYLHKKALNIMASSSNTESGEQREVKASVLHGAKDLKVVSWVFSSTFFTKGKNMTADIRTGNSCSRCP